MLELQLLPSLQKNYDQSWNRALQREDNVLREASNTSLEVCGQFKRKLGKRKNLVITHLHCTMCLLGLPAIQELHLVEKLGSVNDKIQTIQKMLSSHLHRVGKAFRRIYN